MTAQQMTEQALLHVAAAAPRIFSGVVTFAVFWLLSLLSYRVSRRLLRNHHAESDLSDFLTGMIRYALITIGLVTALGTIGLDVRGLVAGLGLTGFALGLALKDLVSNVASGIMILLYRPFHRGDRIAVVGVKGIVRKLTLRHTMIEDEGKRFLVPNAKLLAEVVELDASPGPVAKDARTPRAASPATNTAGVGANTSARDPVLGV